MPHVSKQKLPKKTSYKIEQQFFIMLTGSQGKTEELLAMKALFSETEKIMLAKRLAAILLLSRGISAYKVWMVLKLSPSTTQRLLLGVERGKYKYLTAFVEKRKSKKRVREYIKTLMQIGISEVGKGRWKWLDDLDI